MADRRMRFGKWLLAASAAFAWLWACASAAHAQRGVPPPRVNPPPPPPRVTPPPTTTRVPPPAVHANSKAYNSGPTHVYGIYRTDTKTGDTRLHKVGVSSGTTRTGSQLPADQQRAIQQPARNYSDRALTQTNRLNRTAADAGDAAKYTTRVLKTFDAQPAGGKTSRELALALEKKLVTDGTVKRGEKLSGNDLPRPYPFSWLKKP